MNKIIHNRILKSCEEFANQPAIVRGSSTHTYQELAAAVQSLGDQLLAHSSVKGKVVMVLLPRSFELVTALLASLQTGKVYLPVSTQLGEAVWKQIYETIRPELLITTEDMLPFVSDKNKAQASPVTQAIVLAEGSNALRSAHYANGSFQLADALPVTDVPVTAADPQDTAYLYFTSGSTGVPKIVEGKLISLSHFIDWQLKELDYQPGQRVSQVAAPTFDASLKDILPTLVAGGTLCIPEADLLADSAALSAWVIDQEIYTLATVPSIFRALLQEWETAAQKPASIRQILLAGEVLYNKDILRWREVAGNEAQVINLYGTTESTILKTFYKVPAALAGGAEEAVSVGKAIGNSAIMLLNEAGQLCGVGETGDVYIKTPFLTKGYYQNPEATAAIFMVNPLTGNENDIVYRTGDLGSFSPDGNLLLHGRKDRQVKLRGVRINLDSIKKALLQHDAISQSHVMLQKTASGDDSLVAYFVAERSTEEELRAFAQDSLNQYEVPEHFVKLEAFPFNQHGKLDTKALPNPLEREVLQEAAQVAMSATAMEIKAIWEQFLKVENIGPEDSFLALGGNSLKAIQMGALITKQMQVKLGIAGIQQLFKKPRLADFAAFVESLRDAGSTAPKGIQRVADAADYPVSHAQQQIWMACQTDASNQAHNMPKAYRISGSFDAARFDQAFRAVVAHYEILRTAFRESDQGIRQVIMPAAEAPVHLEIADLREAGEEVVAARVAACTEHLFDLAAPGQYRLALIRIEDDAHVLAVNIHHIIGDSWSANLMARALFSSYGQLMAGEEISLPALPYQFRDYAIWERSQLEGEALNKLKNYWTRHLGLRLPQVTLPLDHERSESRSMAGSRYNFDLSPELARKVSAAAAAQGVSSFSYYMAGFYALLYKYSADEQLVLGVPVATRSQEGLEEQLGVFVNTLAIKASLRAEQPLADFLKQLEQDTRKGYEHQLLPFSELVSHYAAQINRSRNPIFDVAINMLSAGGEELLPAGAGFEISDWESGHQTSKFDLTLYLYDDMEAGAQPFIEYSTTLFEAATIARFASRYLSLLEKMTADDSQTLASLLTEQIAAPTIQRRRRPAAATL